MVRAVVVARTPSARIGLRVMLDGRSCIEVVGDSPDPESMLELEQPPDALVFDYDSESFDLTLGLCARESVALVVIGGDAELASQLSQLPLRGWAILTRDASPEELAAGVQGAAAGLVVLGASAFSAIRDTTPAVSFEVDETLSARENEVLQAMAGGLANKQIAARLGISVHTAKFHVAAILAKLDASSRTEAVTEGVRRGLVHL